LSKHQWSNEPELTYVNHHRDANAVKSKKDEKEKQDLTGNQDKHGQWDKPPVVGNIWGIFLGKTEL
jgi:hypothetical protein